MHQQIIKFWFEELTPQNWFENDPELDIHITSRFTSVLEQAARCELSSRGSRFDERRMKTEGAKGNS